MALKIFPAWLATTVVFSVTAQLVLGDAITKIQGAFDDCNLQLKTNFRIEDKNNPTVLLVKGPSDDTAMCYYQCLMSKLDIYMDNYFYAERDHAYRRNFPDLKSCVADVEIDKCFMKANYVTDEGDGVTSCPRTKTYIECLRGITEC